jgi:acetyltransferase-like isoleucine patch superfamily enzyme
MLFKKAEDWFFKKPIGFKSRILNIYFHLFGLRAGKGNRFENGRVRRLYQIELGSLNVFTHGYCLWPEDIYPDTNKTKIKIGNNNYFNRNFMIDACQLVEIGNDNLFGPDVYITDSNHGIQFGRSSNGLPMNKGFVKIGNNCWVGAKAVILKDVCLGSNCVVGAGSVVTKSFPEGSLIVGVPARLIKKL